MSKELFLQMREQEIATLYDSTFTKKEASQTGINLAKSILENGDVLPHEALANFIRLHEVIGNTISTLKENVNLEKVTVLGVEFTPTNGRSMPQFSDDQTWCEINEKLKEREELLKVAMKSNDEIYDSEGVLVPKISVKYSKDSLVIKY